MSASAVSGGLRGGREQRGCDPAVKERGSEQDTGENLARHRRLPEALDGDTQQPGGDTQQPGQDDDDSQYAGSSRAYSPGCGYAGSPSQSLRFDILTTSFRLGQVAAECLSASG